jgi:hypothetical protein
VPLHVLLGYSFWSYFLRRVVSYVRVRAFELPEKFGGSGSEVLVVDAKYRLFLDLPREERKPFDPSAKLDIVEIIPG